MLPFVKLIAGLCLLVGSFTASWMTFQQFWNEDGVELIETKLVNGQGYSYEFTYNGRKGTYSHAIQMLIDGNMDLLIPLNHAITKRYSSVYWECAPIKFSAISKQSFQFVVLPAVALDGRIADTEVFADQFLTLRGENKNDPFISFLNLGKDSLFVAPVPMISTEPDSSYQRDEILSPLINDHAKKVSMLRSTSDISNFIRNSNPALVTQLWARVGEELLRALESTKIPENPLLELISSEFLTGSSFAKSTSIPTVGSNLRRTALPPSAKVFSVDTAALPYKPGASIWLSTAGISTAWLHVRLDSAPKYYQYAPFRKPCK